jgi:hypothetical protein
MWTQTDIDKAKAELVQKSLMQIQEETAFAWGARALAAFEFWHKGNYPHLRERFLADALEYRHEALEHASLAGPDTYLAVWNGLKALESFV